MVLLQQQQQQQQQVEEGDEGDGAIIWIGFWNTMTKLNTQTEWMMDKRCAGDYESAGWLAGAAPHCHQP
jgi:hypothetical protein